MDHQERTQATAPYLTIAACLRCGKACLIRAPYEPAVNYALATLRPAQMTRGLCEECAAHWWLFSVDGLRWTFEHGYEMLCFTSVRAQLSRLLGLMHPALGQVDWNRLMAQWDLPWPDDWKLPKEGHNG